MLISTSSIRHRGQAPYRNARGLNVHFDRSGSRRTRSFLLCQCIGWFAFASTLTHSALYVYMLVLADGRDIILDEYKPCRNCTRIQRTHTCARAHSSARCENSTCLMCCEIHIHASARARRAAVSTVGCVGFGWWTGM